MYIDSIRLENFRTFREAEIQLVHPDQDFEALKIPTPKLRNVNLVLGSNGLGKSAFLKGIALAALGPAVGDAGIYPYRLVRRDDKLKKKKHADTALIKARFRPHAQDHVPARVKSLVSDIAVQRKGDLETLQWRAREERAWHPIYQADTDALFFVGYGANRRVERRESLDMAARGASAFARAQRIRSLFEETYSLVPLNSWLPSFERSNKGRYTQVRNLINQLAGEEHFRFTGEMEDGEYLFERGGLRVPFPALSDGYRAFLGWIGDLLFHVCMTCPSGKKLVDNRGIVMVDEIDLHLHPKWQMTVVPTLAAVLPNLQFIVTTHSPLIVGSLEWMNLIVMESAEAESSVPRRYVEPVHGLDADQVLLTDFFGMTSTQAGEKDAKLNDLTNKARQGDLDAARTLMRTMAKGLEKAG